MSIVTIPPNLPVKRQDFGLLSFDLTFSNSDSGATQTDVLGPSRRTCALVSEERITSMAEAAQWRALIHATRGLVGRIAVYDILNPVPRGSARGAWTAVTAAAGVATMQIRLGIAQAGKTLLTGDWIGVNQESNQRQLLHVQADAVADGAGLITVAFEPVLRIDVANGSAVIWDRPTCRMRRTRTDASWSSGSRTQGSFSLDLVETWEA